MPQRHAKPRSVQSADAYRSEESRMYTRRFACFLKCRSAQAAKKAVLRATQSYPQSQPSRTYLGVESCVLRQATKNAEHRILTTHHNPQYRYTTHQHTSGIDSRRKGDSQLAGRERQKPQGTDLPPACGDCPFRPVSTTILHIDSGLRKFDT